MPFSREREEVDKVTHGAETWWNVLLEPNTDPPQTKRASRRRRLQELRYDTFLAKEFLFLIVQATVYYWGGGMGNRNGVPAGP